MWKTGNNIHWIAITVFPDCLETFPQIGIYMIYPRGRKSYTKDGVLMITCSGVLVITVTEFVGEHLYIPQKQSSKVVIFIVQKWFLGAKLNFNE
jgi:hypothetical protein